MNNHSEREHARFSPSGAERWINCPGSVVLQDQADEKYKIANKWAIAGTEAHETLEKILRGKLIQNDLEEYRDNAYKTLGWIKEQFPNWKKYKRKAEDRYYADTFFGTPPGSIHGSADLVMFDTQGMELIVLDYKYGTKKVSPVKNKQLMIYAIGAFMDLFVQDMSCNAAQPSDILECKITLGIMQPRVSNGFGAWEADFSIAENLTWLNEFKKSVIKATQTAARFEVDQSGNRDALEYGSWCYWCQAKAICPVYKDETLLDFPTEKQNREEILSLFD